MRNESVARRTRLSASKYRNKRIKRTRELRQKTRALYDILMLRCEITTFSMERLHEKIRKLRHHVMIHKCNCKIQLFKLEHRLQAVTYKFENIQTQLFHTQQIIDNIFVEKLHPYECNESTECILKMQRKLKEDPLSLERKQAIYADITLSISTVTERCSPLHSAVMRAHVKCVKFLLERGADVTSLTAQGETILDSLYDVFHGCIDYDPERLDILKLLLEYGVSSLFNEDPFAGQFALIMAIDKSVEEVSLLLKHGAIMDRSASQNAIPEDAWELFNLQAMKLLFLHHRNRLNFGPGFHVLLKRIIQSCYWRMILAGVPSNEYHEKVLEALQFYKTFGGKFPVYPTNDPNQGLMQFLKSYKHRKHFNAIKSEFKALVSNPLSLQEISRLAVRKYIRRNYVESIKELPLPEALQSVLRFDDVIITELPDDFNKFGDDAYSSSSGDEGSDME